MVPKLHAKGSSFRGAAAYLLHDKDRSGSERVEWTETLNLATENPHSAWKVMAATAMNQGQLKAQAGVKNTGRRSPDSVLHLSLSWHPDERTAMTREEMMRSARGALTALGATDRQALVICHSDEKQPHIHILLNRVSPIDGRMLSSSKEKLALSQWAEAYEKERGEIYCEQRVLNNDERRRNNYTRGDKEQARHIHEAQAGTRPAESIKAEQRRKDAVVAKLERETRERHRNQRFDLETAYKQKLQATRTEAAKKVAREQQRVREGLRPKFQQLLQDHQARTRTFLANEKTLLGRMSNALRAVDFRSLVRGEQPGPDAMTRRRALGDAFNALSSSGARKLALEQRYAREKRMLEAQERRGERQVRRDVVAWRKEETVTARSAFERARVDLMLTQSLEAARVRADWKTRREQRAAAWTKTAGTGQPKDDARLAEARRLGESFRHRQGDSGDGREKERDRDRDR